MAMDLVLASAHHILVLALVASFTAELVLMRNVLDRTTIRRLAVFDAVLGGSATALLIVGVLRLVYGLKGWEFYASNHAFWTKMALFAVISLLSIKPTLTFFRWRKAAVSPDYIAPAAEAASIRRYLHIEALLLFCIPVLAAAMARGMG
jgi:putative membrane protein